MDNIILIGEVAEWLKAHAWKVCKLLKVSRVRIPFSPPRSQMHPVVEKENPSQKDGSLFYKKLINFKQV